MSLILYNVISTLDLLFFVRIWTDNAISIGCILGIPYSQNYHLKGLVSVRLKSSWLSNKWSKILWLNFDVAEALRALIQLYPNIFFIKKNKTWRVAF